MNELWIALALLLVIEGLLPALSPGTFRRYLTAMMQMDERSLRISGLVSMAIGAMLIYLLKN